MSTHKGNRFHLSKTHCNTNCATLTHRVTNPSPLRPNVKARDWGGGFAWRCWEFGNNSVVQVCYMLKWGRDCNQRVEGEKLGRKTELNVSQCLDQTGACCETSCVHTTSRQCSAGCVSQNANSNATNHTALRLIAPSVKGISNKCKIMNHLCQPIHMFHLREPKFGSHLLKTSPYYIKLQLLLFLPLIQRWLGVTSA
jgi:hypothetical protein